MSRKNQNPKVYTFTDLTLDACKAGKIKMFYHKTLRNADDTPLRVRVSGKTHTWKKRPNEFKTPVKYGLYDSTYITHENMHEWASAYTESRHMDRNDAIMGTIDFSWSD